MGTMMHPMKRGGELPVSKSDAIFFQCGDVMEMYRRMHYEQQPMTSFKNELLPQSSC